MTLPALSSSEVYLFSVQGRVQILDLGLVGLCEKRPDDCVCLEQRVSVTWKSTWQQALNQDLPGESHSLPPDPHTLGLSGAAPAVFPSNITCCVCLQDCSWEKWASEEPRWLTCASVWTKQLWKLSQWLFGKSGFDWLIDFLSRYLMVMPVTLQVSVVSTEFVFIQLYYTVPNTAMSILQCYSDCCILIIFYAYSLQVLPLWHCISHSWKDLGDGRSISYRTEAGAVCHYSSVRAYLAWTHPFTSAFCAHHQEKPLCLYSGDTASLADRLSYILQVGKYGWNLQIPQSRDLV